VTGRGVEPLAGLGPRLAGWFVDLVLGGLVSVVLLAVDLAPWSRALVLGVLLTANAVVLVAWRGGNVGNLVVGIEVVAAGPDSDPDAGARLGLARATVRWAVVAVPIVAAGAAGWWWLAALWVLAVFGPVAFTRRHQGVHDLAAGALVVQRRPVTEGWRATALLRRVAR
jgi:hypothetical protein